MSKLTEKRLAEMWCELNCWKCPPELAKTGLTRDDSRRSPFMELLSALTSVEAVNEAWRRSQGLDKPKRKPKRKSR